jgi:hypothetical protein
VPDLFVGGGEGKKSVVRSTFGDAAMDRRRSRRKKVLTGDIEDS